jgi:uncharacterized membrane protein
MRLRLLYFWDVLKASFWFLPLLLLLLGILLSTGLYYLDTQVGLEGFPTLVQNLIGGGTESARSVLSTISGAMLGMASTVFSITLVALTLASSQFGSRLLRNFMYDRLNQVVLGSFLGTFIYCLLTLKTVRTFETEVFVPHFSILLAILLAIVNMILLIVFIHHISVSIQADHVIADVSQHLDKRIEHFAQLGTRQEALSESKRQEQFQAAARKTAARGEITSQRSGYIQVIDYAQLLRIAEENDLLLDIHYRPRDFIVSGVKLFEYFGPAGISDALRSQLLGTFILGKTRTPTGDIEFAIHQLVEIASRALSPGINDPYTAKACLDNLTAALCKVAKAPFPSAYRLDRSGQVRLKVNTTDFAGVMGAALNQIRQYGQGNPTILIRMLEALHTIQVVTEDKDRLRVVQQHAEMVLRAGKSSIQEQRDLQDLRKRADRILKDV